MSHFGPRRRKHLWGQSPLLNPEPLEPRLLLSVNSVTAKLATAGPQTAPAPIVLKPASSSSSNPSVLSSREIRERSVLVSVVPSTANTSAYRYEWQAIKSPTGGKVTFAQNASNAAKANTLTFTRPGTYTVRVNVRNGSSFVSSGTLQFNVVQSITAISVKTETGQTFSSSGLSVKGTSQRLTAIALDQFGTPLSQQPSITLRITKRPAGSTPEISANENSVLANFNRAGAYVLRAQSGAVVLNASLNVMQTASSLSLLQPDGRVVDPGQPITVASASQRLTVRSLDQFGYAMVTLPEITWTTVSAPTGGTASAQISSTNATVAFKSVGSYSVAAQSGLLRCEAAFKVVQAFSRIVAAGTDNKVLANNATISVTGTDALLTAMGLDQFGMLMSVQPSLTWAGVTNPSGGQATLNSNENQATFTFNKAGAYTVKATSGNLIMNLKFTVVQTATSLTLTPGNLEITFSATRQIAVVILDQFGSPLSTQPTVTWTTTGGTISSKGLFTAGKQAGSLSISGRTGTLISTINVEVTAPVAPSGLNDPALANLVNTFYADQRIDRTEMIQILRSAGSDGSVNAAELADFRFLVAPNTPFVMPLHIRELASDVVGSNLANRMFRGQAAGNLVAGSSSALLNNLVDKWFLGADEPQITIAGLTYQSTIGNLFNGTPSRANARQGQLGDCYFIAAVSAIADRNPAAVQNLFVDNGDGTYTVRFYYGVSSGIPKADYVTVNRRLPAYSNRTLGYSGYGQSVTAASTTLWIALAEKAYAQWNETGNEGRDGTNRYSAIEGGWMSNVNMQVLGYNSINTSFLSSSKQVLVNALTARQAVTLGTLANKSAGGLVGSHAYIVTGYNSSTDTFTLHNPWGVAHPTPLTWAQLQANCSKFTVTNTAGLAGLNSSSVANLPRATQVSPISNRTLAGSVQGVSYVQLTQLPQWSANKTPDSTPVDLSGANKEEYLPDDPEGRAASRLDSRFSPTEHQLVLSPEIQNTEQYLALTDLAFMDFDLSAI
jgi:plastocyanin